MMKKLNSKELFASMLFLACGLFSSAQNISVYGLDKAFTKNRILRLKSTPAVHTIITKQYVNIEPTTVKKTSQKYLNLKSSIKTLDTEVRELKKNYEVSLDKYNNINTIVEKINTYLTSQKPFEIKKAFLKEAQLLALENKITEKFYGDHSVNPSFKSRFLVYSLNKIELKIHLKRVVSRIQQINIKPEPFQSPKNSELELLRNKLQKTKPYIYINGPAKKTYSNYLTLGNKIEKVYDLTGDFRIINESYIITKDVTNKFKKGQLVEKNKIDRLGSDTRAFTDKNTLYIIESIGQTNSKKYTVEKSFFKNYGYTFDGKFRYQVKDFLSDAISLN